MKKILVVLLAIIILMLGIAVPEVLAVGFTFSMVADKTELKPGEELIITLAVSNIDLGQNGMNTLEGQLVYDKNVFEEVKSSNISSLNNWSVTYNDEATDLNGKFLAMIVTTGVKTDQNVATIKLKVKQSIEEQTTTILIKDIATNNGTSLVEEADKSINIIIKTEQENDPGELDPPGEQETPGDGSDGQDTPGDGSEEQEIPGDGSDGQDTPGGGSDGQGTSGSGSGGQGTPGSGSGAEDTSGSKENLPQAGENSKYYLILIPIIFIVGIVSYIQYRKWKNID